MLEFQVHATAEELRLDHGAAPSRAIDADRSRFRAEFGVAGDEGILAVEDDQFVNAVAGFNNEYGAGSQIPKVDAAFDLRTNEIAIQRVAERGMRGDRFARVSASGGHGVRCTVAVATNASTVDGAN